MVALAPASFVYPADLDVVWHKTMPEFACAANGVSMLMPHVEPYVVRSVRAVLDDLDDDLAVEARKYVAQEAAHHGQHGRFNKLVIARFGSLSTTETAMSATFSLVERWSTPHFGVGFAAGFETVAYASARWVADHEMELFRSADSEASQLFLWHLAEEVEHKSVAIDVFRAIGGKRWTYAMGMLLSVLLLAVFSWVNTTLMLLATGRFFNPIAHFRLVRWTISFLFELLPSMLFSLQANHHPSHCVDPLLYEVWLREFRAD